jgi:hypothetical protein
MRDRRRRKKAMGTVERVELLLEEYDLVNQVLFSVLFWQKHPELALDPNQVTVSSVDDLTRMALLPSDIGLDYFPSFRPAQLEALEFSLNSVKRFVGVCLPTGAGKSLYAMALSKLYGGKAAILTHTKGLMDQYQHTFSRYGLVDIKGKSNYQCVDRPHVSCRFGAHEGCRCAGKEWCAYEQQRLKAKGADVLQTNYAYWVRVHQRQKASLCLEGEAVFPADPGRRTPSYGSLEPIASGADQGA